jgi:hypothetical protein
VAKSNHLSPGQRRFEWLRAIVSDSKYTRLAVRVAERLSFKYSNSVTAQTFVGVKKLAAELDVTERAVQRILSTFFDDGFLTKIKLRAPNQPTIFVLTIPQVPAADSNKPPASKKKPAAPKTFEEFAVYQCQWMNAERDVEKVKARWSSPTERKIRAEVCDGKGAFDSARFLLEQRLTYGECHHGEDWIPF